VNLIKYKYNTILVKPVTIKLQLFKHVGSATTLQINSAKCYSIQLISIREKTFITIVSLNLCTFYWYIKYTQIDILWQLLVSLKHFKGKVVALFSRQIRVFFILIFLSWCYHNLISGRISARLHLVLTYQEFKTSKFFSRQINIKICPY